MLFRSTSSMHFAVQEAARCASVKTTICSDSASTVTYAQARYQGPIISPVFSYNTSGCGHTVNGTATFTLVAIITSVSVPISVTACYP